MGVVDNQRIAVELGYSETTFIDTSTPRRQRRGEDAELIPR